MTKRKNFAPQKRRLACLGKKKPEMKTTNPLRGTIEQKAPRTTQKKRTTQKDLRQRAPPQVQAYQNLPLAQH
ncbi:MAG: hypothetical protein LLF76_09020 [Planctomycetaceae bacterium]|nr:hypothetical protein [Planctomycetaceae bacterium]